MEPGSSAVVQLKKFFEHRTRAVSLPEISAFFKFCTNAEKQEFKVAVEAWDGMSEFISGKQQLALPAGEPLQPAA